MKKPTFAFLNYTSNRCIVNGNFNEQNLILDPSLPNQIRLHLNHNWIPMIEWIYLIRGFHLCLFMSSSLIGSFVERGYRFSSSTMLSITKGLIVYQFAIVLKKILKWHVVYGRNDCDGRWSSEILENAYIMETGVSKDVNKTSYTILCTTLILGLTFIPISWQLRQVDISIFKKLHHRSTLSP